MRCGLFERSFLANSDEGSLTGHQAIGRARHAPAGQHGQRTAAKLAEAAANQNPIMNTVMSWPAPSAMADDRPPVTRRTLSGQPLGVILSGLASIAGTWDKDDHGAKASPGIVTRQGT